MKTFIPTFYKQTKMLPAGLVKVPCEQQSEK